jgi:quinoprotein glucose dehydrogenase
MNKNSIILLFLVNIIYFFSGIVSFANWSTSSQNYQSHKFSELKNININNIKDLKLGWIYQNGYIPSGSIKINNQLTPIYTGNSIILTSLNNYLISVNPASGKENCRIKMPSELGMRGISYHKINRDNIIFVPTSNGIYAINESDCSLNLNIGNKGTFGSNRSVVSPIIAGNKIYIAFLNKIESYEINSNEKLWSFNLENSRVWSGFSYSEKNNYPFTEFSSSSTYKWICFSGFIQ